MKKKSDPVSEKIHENRSNMITSRQQLPKGCRQYYISKKELKAVKANPILVLRKQRQNHKDCSAIYSCYSLILDIFKMVAAIILVFRNSSFCLILKKATTKLSVSAGQIA